MSQETTTKSLFRNLFTTEVPPATEAMKQTEIRQKYVTNKWKEEQIKNQNASDNICRQLIKSRIESGIYVAFCPYDISSQFSNELQQKGYTLTKVEYEFDAVSQRDDCTAVDWSQKS